MRGGAALATGLVLVAVLAGPAAGLSEPVPAPPYPSPTVTVEARWSTFEDLLFTYVATTSADPVGDRFGDRAAWHTAGCGPDAIIEEPLVPLLVRSEGALAADNVGVGSGRWSLVVASAGHCAYFDAAGNPDNARYDQVLARYPVGTSVPVTLVVRAYAPGEAAPATTDTMVFDVPVETGVPDTAVLFGAFELPAVPGGADAGTTGGDDGAAADAPAPGATVAGTDAAPIGRSDDTEGFRLLVLVLTMVVLGLTIAGVLWWFLTREAPPAGAPYWQDWSIRSRPPSSGWESQAGPIGSATTEADVPIDTTGWEGGERVEVPSGRYRIGYRQEGWVSVDVGHPAGGEHWVWVREQELVGPR